MERESLHASPRSLPVLNLDPISDDVRIPKMDARAVKDALLRRHPSVGEYDSPGAWTCLEEFENIDLLAFAAWTKPKPARVVGARIGYEVKVSRGDMRSELLNPGKRMLSVQRCHEFYFAVPAGLLTDDEKAWVEPEWGDRDFSRTYCPEGCRAPDRWNRRGQERDRGYGRQVTAQGPLNRYEYGLYAWIPCETCGGLGYLERSRVEREAPTLWIPADVGLVEITPRGVSVVKKAPLNEEPRDFGSKALGELVRWASYRPDRRHLELHRRTGIESATTENEAAA